MMLVVSVFFAFTYPLIVDRHLSGVDAVRLSVKAALGNLGGLLVLHVLTMAMSLAGLCFCYVGAFFVAPVTLGAMMVAYARVFGLTDRPPAPPGP
jgi:uncharacterized membrane protein